MCIKVLDRKGPFSYMLLLRIVEKPGLFIKYFANNILKFKLKINKNYYLHKTLKPS